MTQADTLSPIALMRQLGTAQAPVIIDVCIDEDVQADPFLIPTAQRWDHFNISALPSDIKKKNLVIACQKGRKLSQGAAALLRAEGVRAQVLDGGVMAWRAAGLPRVPLDLLPGPGAPDLWVTAQGPSRDALACAWLIRRFISRRATCLFVPRSDIAEVATRFTALPFADGDSPGFAAMLRRYGLETPALQRMARALGPDAPETSGLNAVFAGLQCGEQDDHARSDAALTLCDALYLWACADETDQVAA
ncbi:chromate resistance protein ChrB domain-containing protein [uncultured Roseobacter sp.]|uniref:chromate resistance protein ChrB domain-containing protein n=1 Tax=uncultured Roseobacter sp. TaxID=114847 RepID=UPI00261F32A9|nr:chromate resistance protein ChrB domain-containing protein [uncultured Roseobacter sp.]